MRVLVLGGNRYIGLQLVFELARRGHEVTVFNSHPAALPEGVRRLHGDRRQPGVIEEILTPHRDEFDAVFDNTSYQVADMQPLVELFRGRLKHYVFTSSIAVYLQSDVQPIAEDSPVSAEDAVSLYASYGSGKVRCERFLRAEYERNGFPATTLRVSHTCGPNSPLATREPGFFARLEAGRPILIPGDGMPFVHMVHVQDVARAMCAIPGSQRAAGQVYNVAGLEFSSIVGYIRLMARVVGVEPRLTHVAAEIARGLQMPVVHWREWALGGMVFSIEKAQRELGWQPQLGLQSALEDAYRWFITEGRERYSFDFSQDDAIIARLRAAQ